MKTKTAHTPGPWHTPGKIFSPMAYGNARSNHHRPAKYRAIGIGNGACHIGYASVTPAVSDIEAQANARLIAAAPQLLLCIERFLEFGAAGGDTSWQSKDAQPLFYEMMVAVGQVVGSAQAGRQAAA